MSSGTKPERSSSSVSSNDAPDAKDVKVAQVLRDSGLEVGSYDKNKYAVSPTGQLVAIYGDVDANALISTAPGEGIPQRGGKLINRDDWLPMKGEGYGSYLKRLLFEGHTVIDVFMLTANCVGQVVLTNPWALHNSGLVSGSIIWVVGLLMGIWTTWSYMVLYLEYKRDKIRDGSWWDTDGQHKYVAQWFDIVGHYLGKWPKMIAGGVMLVNLTGAAVVQTVASANSIYTIDKKYNKRTWSLILGGSMVLLVILTPKFTKFRLIAVVGLLGTFYAATYGIAMAAEVGPLPQEDLQLWPVTGVQRPGSTTLQNFFNGAAIQLGEATGHALVVESLESMENPKHYYLAYFAGMLYILYVTAGHTYALNLSKYAPKLVTGQNMYAIFAVTAAKRAGVATMQIHNYVAYLLWGTQFCLIAEKAVGIHTRPYWMRALMRVPFAGLWLFLALLLPFYGTINSLLSSLGSNIVAFVLLSISSSKLYRRKEARDACVMPPFKWLQWRNWLLVHVINIFIAVFFSVFSVMSLYYAIIAVKEDYKNWAFLPECYLC